MWTITTDQAVEMYARFCRSRYGANAKKVAEEKTAVLRRLGDAEGEHVWTKVTQQIEIQDAH
jgi:predicted phage gp36 major capsid-like protein